MPIFKNVVLNSSLNISGGFYLAYPTECKGKGFCSARIHL